VVERRSSPFPLFARIPDTSTAWGTTPTPTPTGGEGRGQPERSVTLIHRPTRGFSVSKGGHPIPPFHQRRDDVGLLPHFLHQTKGTNEPTCTQHSRSCESHFTSLEAVDAHRESRLAASAPAPSPSCRRAPRGWSGRVPAGSPARPPRSASRSTPWFVRANTPPKGVRRPRAASERLPSRTGGTGFSAAHRPEQDSDATPAAWRLDAARNQTLTPRLAALKCTQGQRRWLGREEPRTKGEGV
jgi:hypothetical protein